MQVTVDLLKRFFNGKCSQNEEQAVRDWFVENPDKLDQYLSEESWLQFKTDVKVVVSSQRMLEYIEAAITLRRSRFKWWAVAASIVICLATGASLLRWEKSASDRLPASVIPCVIVENNSYVNKKISLPDSSIVMLAPGSSISYDSVFGSRRDITLWGDASFSVAKDPMRPFCVHAKNINITALGTMFSVSDKDSVLTSIKLYEGKVVVREEPYIGKAFGNVYLLPGQEFRFNNINFSNTVRFFDKPQQAKTTIAKPTQPLVSLYFNNETLPDVFAKIENQHHVKILFNAQELETIRFTGTYKPESETIEVFLSTIAVLNDLNISKTKNGFLVKPN